MGDSFEQERREFIRVKCEVPVRYKFLTKTRQDPALDNIYEGTSTNVSGGGILLNGKIPNLTWIPDLLMQKMVVGINILLPNEEKPIKALTRVSWLESMDDQTQRCAIGLRFKEITAEDRDKIFKFVIKAQMPS